MDGERAPPHRRAAAAAGPPRPAAACAGRGDPLASHGATARERAGSASERERDASGRRRERGHVSHGIAIVRSRRRGDGRRKRDRPTERARQVRRSKEEIVRRARFGALRGEQRELRVGDFELRAQAAREAQRREPERLVGLGGVLLARGEHGARATQLGAGARDVERDRLALLPQLQLGERAPAPARGRRSTSRGSRRRAEARC